jgi:hypothetical protein
MNTDPELRAPGNGDEVRASAADTEGHVRYMLDEQGNPDVVRPGEGEDAEGHVRF